MNYVIKPLSQKSLFTAKFQQVQTHYNERYIINKTTERRHLAHNHETDLILLYDEKGKILEFDIGNIMIEKVHTIRRVMTTTFIGMHASISYR